MNKGWTTAQDKQLVRLHLSTNMFFSDIAKRLGRKPQVVRWRARLLGLDMRKNSSLMGKWNSKHSHLREDALKFFLSHTFEETMASFDLTRSELKSLFTVAYRDPKLKHLRKETRCHDAWSTKELLFLLQHAGLVQRKYILKNLGKRGAKNVCTIKERMQALGIASRNLHGLTVAQYQTMFGKSPSFFLKTDAGPPGFRWRIVPWFHLDQEIKSKKIAVSQSIKLYVNSMSLFQQWIYQNKAKAKMQKICKAARL